MSDLFRVVLGEVWERSDPCQGRLSANSRLHEMLTDLYEGLHQSSSMQHQNSHLSVRVMPRLGNDGVDAQPFSLSAWTIFRNALGFFLGSFGPKSDFRSQVRMVVRMSGQFGGSDL